MTATNQQSRLLPPVLLLSVAVVARNEQEYLPGLLADLREQDFPAAATELLLIDSLSQDDTRELMLTFQRDNPQFQRVDVLSNAGRYLPQGCNLALREAGGDALLRVDAHASLPPDFLRRSVECLNDGYYACGGRRLMALRRPGPWRDLLLAAETSWFGSGGATYRRVARPGPAKSVFHGAYRREVFTRVGTYDERLLRTEDNDMSFRLRQAGYTIYLNPRIVSTQFIRSSPGSFLRQKAANGYWIGRTLLIQPGCVGLLNLAPTLFVLALLVTLGVGLFLNWLPLLLLAVVYLATSILASALSFRAAATASWRFACLPLLFLLMHLGYGAGTLLGALRGLFRSQARNFGAYV